MYTCVTDVAGRSTLVTMVVMASYALHSTNARVQVKPRSWRCCVAGAVHTQPKSFGDGATKMYAVTARFGLSSFNRLWRWTERQSLTLTATEFLCEDVIAQRA
jgi:hypothetical protein